jgi:mycofactocin glycosyltransferase
MTPSRSVLRLVPDPSLQRWADGRTLAGGSPLRVLRLSDQGASFVEKWLGGQPVPADPASRRLAERLVRIGMAHPVYDNAQLASTDVTVVVPVKREHDDSSTVVAPVADVADVVVVDDGSSIPVPGATIRNEAARGPAAARNQGWCRVQTPVVAFLDADTIPEPGWLEPLLRHFEDPAVVAVAPRIRSTPGETPLARYEQIRSSLDLGAEPGPVLPGSRISYVPSAALVVRTAMLQELGGFDENLRFGEDVDLVWRLVARGYQVRYEPSSVVGHTPRAQWSTWLRQRFDYGTSAAPLAQRHGDAVAPVRMSVWTAIAWSTVLAGRSPFGLAIAAMTAVLLARKLGPAKVPAREAVRLAAHGNLGAARLLADAIARPWAPIAVPLLIRTRRGRAVLGLVAARHVVEWARRRPQLDPVRWTLARIADDLAYGAGVCWGALRQRTATPLLPHLSDLPGRSSVNVTEPQAGEKP